MSGWHNPLGLSGVEKGGRTVRWELNCCVRNQGTGKSGKVHRHNHQRKDLQEAVHTQAVKSIKEKRAHRKLPLDSRWLGGGS